MVRSHVVFLYWKCRTLSDLALRRTLGIMFCRRQIMRQMFYRALRKNESSSTHAVAGGRIFILTMESLVFTKLCSLFKKRPQYCFTFHNKKSECRYEKRRVNGWEFDRTVIEHNEFVTRDFAPTISSQSLDLAHEKLNRKVCHATKHVKTRAFDNKKTPWTHCHILSQWSKRNKKTTETLGIFMFRKTPFVCPSARSN
jgi:hypothetical protein